MKELKITIKDVNKPELAEQLIGIVSIYDLANFGETILELAQSLFKLFDSPVKPPNEKKIFRMFKNGFSVQYIAERHKMSTEQVLRTIINQINKNL